MNDKKVELDYKYFEEEIRSWRRVKKGFEVEKSEEDQKLASCYIDAYQSILSSHGLPMVPDEETVSSIGDKEKQFMNFLKDNIDSVSSKEESCNKLDKEIKNIDLGHIQEVIDYHIAIAIHKNRKYILQTVLEKFEEIYNTSTEKQ